MALQNQNVFPEKEVFLLGLLISPLIKNEPLSSSFR